MLTKPGRLDDQEMQSIREHPARGAKMVERIPPLRDLMGAVHQHHEWIDGHGYPDHTSGEGLSMAARILSIADSYDAMTTTRSYRPALSREEAVAELLRGAGTQFDADIVRVFIEARVGGPEAQYTAVGQADHLTVPANVSAGG